MAKKQEYESSIIQSHLNIIQSIIERMSTNSASSKTWCITIVSAILVLIADKGQSQYALIAIIPTFLFLFLDAYYLGLEKGFRSSYDNFLIKWDKHTIENRDLFWTKPEGNRFLYFLQALKSFSVWPFYTTLIGMIIASKYLIIEIKGA